jgi:hypothetical protein
MTTRSGPADGRSDPGLDAIMSERRHLLNLAYRLLGSLADAEDAVQETYACWYAMSGQQQDAIESPGAWLTTVASRICLNLLGSARARRERYVGEWLPEPLPEPAEWSSGQPGATTATARSATVDEWRPHMHSQHIRPAVPSPTRAPQRARPSADCACADSGQSLRQLGAAAADRGGRSLTSRVHAELAAVQSAIRGGGDPSGLGGYEAGRQLGQPR